MALLTYIQAPFSLWCTPSIGSHKAVHPLPARPHESRPPSPPLPSSRRYEARTTGRYFTCELRRQACQPAFPRCRYTHNPACGTFLATVSDKAARRNARTLGGTTSETSIEVAAEGTCPSNHGAAPAGSRLAPSSLHLTRARARRTPPCGRRASGFAGMPGVGSARARGKNGWWGACPWGGVRLLAHDAAVAPCWPPSESMCPARSVRPAFCRRQTRRPAARRPRTSEQ
jgi:hypothetical protein